MWTFNSFIQRINRSSQYIPTPASGGWRVAAGQASQLLRARSRELAGNALGRLDLLWATFVLLGGYSSSLKQVDFWIATAMPS